MWCRKVHQGTLVLRDDVIVDCGSMVWHKILKWQVKGMDYSRCSI